MQKIAFVYIFMATKRGKRINIIKRYGLPRQNGKLTRNLLVAFRAIEVLVDMCGRISFVNNVRRKNAEVEFDIEAID